MNRREITAGLILSLLPAVSSAQGRDRQYRLAYISTFEELSNLSESSTNPNVRAFMLEMRTLGYVEGRNLVIERYSGAAGPEQHSGIARRIVETSPDVAFATSTFVAALMNAGASFPIVGIVGDPVAYGFGESLAHPGRNVTGVTMDAGLEIFGKYLDLLRRIKPQLEKVGFLTLDFDTPHGRALREAARSLGITIVGTPVGTPVSEASLRRAIAGCVENGAEAVIVGASSVINAKRKFIVEELASRRLAAIGAQVELAKLGALAAYAVDLEEIFRTGARYVDRILKGANPAEMPFIQPTRWRLVVNLKTARALGIDVGPSLLATADEVIE